MCKDNYKQYLNLLYDGGNYETDSQAKEFFPHIRIEGYTIDFQYTKSFSEGIKLLSQNEYDIAILDIFKGTPAEGNKDRPGEIIFEKIRESCFIPIIFYTGLPNHVEHLKSDIIRVVRKTDGLRKVMDEIESLINTGLPAIRKKLSEHIRDSMRKYFWDFVQLNWEKFSTISDEVSLGYLLIRRLAEELKSSDISENFKDNHDIKSYSHPMEYYIYPPIQEGYETGDILKLGDEFFLIITPTCDFIKRANGKIKANYALLVECSPFSSHEIYIKYSNNRNEKNLNNLISFIENRKGDQYFFLPKTPFIDHCYLDFQKILSVNYTKLVHYEKIARIDDPYVQSVIATFNRYYIRIGTHDINSNMIIETLFP